MYVRDRSPILDPTRLAIAITGALICCPELGRAQPVASAVDPMAGAPPSGTRRDEPVDEPIIWPAPRPVREPTAADVAGAPVPGQESGRLDRVDGGDSTPRLIGRGFLFLPRLAIRAALAPIRVGIWANERYRLRDRAHETVFNEPGTMGLYPTVGYLSSYGVTFGGRFVHRDLLGAREHFAVSAMIGGRFRQAFEASLRTGDRLGERVQITLKGEYDRRGRERFYGIGNGDDATAPPAPIDALTDPTAVEARYQQQLLRASAIVDARIASDLHLLGSGALTDLAVDAGEGGGSIDELYQMDSLIGRSGVRHAYTELELRWDGRRSVSPWEPRPIYTGGSFAGLYGGRVHRPGGGADFWRYGLEVQHFLRLGRGPRVLAARAHVEAVSGTRDEVPFFDLPQIGGAKLLRGYATERFRDRIAAVGSLDYEWGLSQLFSARLFTDAGRVYASADDLELAGLRVGYGLGIDAHSRSSFWLRTSLASSIDGGVFLYLSFESVFGVDPRVEKR
jgi:hypothetical protein